MVLGYAVASCHRLSSRHVWPLHGDQGRDCAASDCAVKGTLTERCPRVVLIFNRSVAATMQNP